METLTTASQPPIEASSRPKAHARTSWIGIIAGLMMIIILFFLILAGLEIADLQTDLARANRTIENIEMQQQRQSQQWNEAHPKINGQLQQITNTQGEQHLQLDLLKQQLEAWRNRWQQQLSQDPLKRQINDLQDVLDQAGRHLLLTASIPQTQALLEQAHALCTRFDSTLLQPVCLLIAQDKQAILTYQSPDINQVLEQLSQLESQLLLPLQQAQRLIFAPSTSTSTSSTDANVDTKLHYLLNKLLTVLQKIGYFIRDHLVKVHHLHQPSDHHYQLQLPQLDQLTTHLNLLFQQARTAALIQNQSAFQATLGEIQMFAKNQSGLAMTQDKLFAQLEQLRQTSITSLPIISLKAKEMLFRISKSYGETSYGETNGTIEDHTRASATDHSSTPATINIPNKINTSDTLAPSRTISPRSPARQASPEASP